MKGNSLEILTRMALEAEALGVETAAESRQRPESDFPGSHVPESHPAVRLSSACLPFSRLERLAAGSIAQRGESAHLQACKLCSVRLRAFASPSIWNSRTLRLQPVRRWLVQGVGVAASVALLLVWSVRPVYMRTAYTSHEPRWLRQETKGATAMAFPWATSCIEGDADCDGFITDQDTDAFFLAVANPEQFREIYRGCEITCGNDINGDGVVDYRDIAPFIACMFDR